MERSQALLKLYKMIALSKNVAEIQLSYRPTDSEEVVITSSQDAYYELLKWFPDETIALQERFVVLYLNRANRVLGAFLASEGGISSTVADPRIILGTGLKLAASNLILAHNHPSGSLKASAQDVELTEKLVSGGKLLDLNVLDHIIVTPFLGRFTSFADEGII